MSAGGDQAKAASKGFARRAFARFAALLAIFLHVLVVQGHVHAGAGNSPIAGVGVSGAAFSQDFSLPSDAAQACVLCHAMAAAGHGLAPSAVLVLAATSIALPLDYFTQGLIALARLRLWQSRAPPAAL